MAEQARQGTSKASASGGEVVSGRGGPPFVQSEVRAGWGIRPGDGALVVGARTRAPFVQSFSGAARPLGGRLASRPESHEEVR